MANFVVRTPRQLRLILAEYIPADEVELMATGIGQSLREDGEVIYPRNGDEEPLIFIALSVQRKRDRIAGEWRKKQQKRQYWIDKKKKEKGELPPDWMRPK